MFCFAGIGPSGCPGPENRTLAPKEVEGSSAFPPLASELPPSVPQTAQRQDGFHQAAERSAAAEEEENPTQAEPSGPMMGAAAQNVAASQTAGQCHDASTTEDGILLPPP